MATSPYKALPTHRLTVSSLLSPPEMKRSESFGSSIAPSGAPTSPFSSFNSAQSNPESRGKFLATLAAAGPAPFTTAPNLYASPPISPYDSQSQKENLSVADEQGSRDPQLFGSGDATMPAAHVPLFPQESQESEHQDLISQHMRSASYVNSKVQMPARDEYEQALTFVSTFATEFRKDPRAWWKRERQFDEYYSNARKAAEAKKIAQSKGSQKISGLRAMKGLAPAPSSRPRMAIPRVESRPSRVTKPKRTPKTQILDSFDFSPELSSPKPPRPATNRDDTDYNSLPDFSPPLDTLAKDDKSALKAEWKGTVLDLSNDPDRHLLHKAELHLAATLRLNCATYLCSKRRVFQARVEALKKGKEFRKTDAQQACKIDVNKASKLWAAYQKVGWFDPKYFRNQV